MTDAITDEGVARLRARIGVAHPHPQPPHYRFPNEDAFRHVALAYGDDNPLWCDPDYAAQSRWGGSIAPPHLAGGDTQVTHCVFSGNQAQLENYYLTGPQGHLFALTTGQWFYDQVHAGNRSRRQPVWRKNVIDDLDRINGLRFIDDCQFVPDQA